MLAERLLAETLPPNATCYVTDRNGRAAAGAQVTVYVSLVISKPTLPMKISSGSKGSQADGDAIENLMVGATAVPAKSDLSLGALIGGVVLAFMIFLQKGDVAFACSDRARSLVMPSFLVNSPPVA